MDCKPLAALFVVLLITLKGSAQQYGAPSEKKPTIVQNDARKGADTLPRVEIGGLFTTLIIPDDTRAGFGFRGVYNIRPFLSLEGELDWSLGNPLFRAEGGRMIEGLFGVKAGRRGKRVGIFAKARPGFISFSDVLGNSGLARSTSPAIDLGGVIEFYPSRHWSIRGDIGDTLFFPSGQAAQNSAQLSMGVHYRF